MPFLQPTHAFNRFCNASLRCNRRHVYVAEHVWSQLYVIHTCSTAQPRQNYTELNVELFEYAGDCIHPSRGQSSHYCAALFKYDVLYHNIAYCVTILVCMVLAGREYNIHMSAPQWGGWYFTFYPPLLHSAAPTIVNVSCHHPHFS